ncbi:MULTISPECIES: hypothetical protein [Brevibacillus]|uniref:hypothetical protein n=1 Tax=Brevibacillus TaxID=55080 RepID=UPI0012697C37|nr:MULTISPECIES: hypothetical protein [Brevibacillus]
MEIVAVIFYVIWLALTAFIALKPRAFWKTFGGWKATRNPSPVYFLFIRVFGILAFSSTLLYFLAQIN